MRQPGRAHIHHAGIGATALLACSFSLAGAFSQAPASPQVADAVAQSMPAEGTERLVYHVEWDPPGYLFFLPTMDVGEATLSLAGATEYKDRKALKIIFTARSSGTMVKLAGIRIDDYYEFLTDAETFCTFTVIKREREGKRMRDIDLIYLPESRKVHVREVDVSTTVQRIIRDKDYDQIPPCVKDLFSALYSVRRTEMSAGASNVVLVGDNEKVKEISIQVKKKESVKTPAGKFDAWQVDTVAVLGGLFKDGGQFRMWLSADERKMPVKFEAKVSLGKVTGSLTTAR